MDEAKFENGCEQLILLGSDGQRTSIAGRAYFAKKGCTVLLQPTPKAILTFNNSHAKKIGPFLRTCSIAPAATALRRKTPMMRSVKS